MARILLIDDDAPFRSMLSQTLAHFGHTVTQACNGREGLNLLARDPADLVITDVVMPEKEGMEVLMELREQRPQPKIIVISGGGRVSAEEYLGFAKLLGAGATLTKPFSNEALLAAIAQLLLSDGPSREPAALTLRMRHRTEPASAVMVPLKDSLGR
jgi:DNA-binding response OmpR family regulator